MLIKHLVIGFSLFKFCGLLTGCIINFIVPHPRLNRIGQLKFLQIRIKVNLNHTGRTGGRDRIRIGDCNGSRLLANGAVDDTKRISAGWRTGREIGAAP